MLVLLLFSFFKEESSESILANHLKQWEEERERGEGRKGGGEEQGQAGRGRISKNKEEAK